MTVPSRRAARGTRPSGRPKPFLLATGDEDALLVARTRIGCAEKYCFVSPSHDALEGIVDKARLYEAAREHESHIRGFTSSGMRATSMRPSQRSARPATSSRHWPTNGGASGAASSSAPNTHADLRQILLDFVALGLVAIPIEIIPGGDGDVHSVSHLHRSHRSSSRVADEAKDPAVPAECGRRLRPGDYGPA